MVLLVKLLSGIVSGALMFLVRWPRLYQLSDRAFAWWAFGVFAASRLALYVGIYVVLRWSAEADLALYYLWGKQLLEGLPLYTKISSCYSPPYTYITAGVLQLWDSHHPLVLLTLAIELAALPVWLWVGRRLFPERQVRIATVFFVASTVPLWVASIGGNSLWISLFLALSLALFLTRREVLSGAALGASIGMVKFLPLLYGPAMACGTRRWVRWSIAFVTVPAAILGAYWIAGYDIVRPYHDLKLEFSSSGLPFLLTLFGPDMGSRHAPNAYKSIVDAVGMGFLAAVALAAFLRSQRLPPSPVRAIYLIVLMQTAMLFVSKKSQVSYLGMCFFPLCLTLAASELKRGGLWFWALFQVISAVEQSFWYRTMDLKQLNVLLHWPLPPGIKLRDALLVLVMQFPMVAFYLWSAMKAWRLAFPKPPAASLESKVIP